MGGSTRNRIARVAANGTLDAGFNPNANNWVFSVAVQADGKILLAGWFTSVGGSTCNRIARVASNGTLDAGFNPNANGNIYCLGVQADGGILLGGDFTSVGGTTRNRIARVAANGTLDGAFNPNANSYVYNVAQQADGKILLGGAFTSVGGTGRSYFARLLNDPAPQTLSPMDSTQVVWTRGGSAPEITQTTFELSTNGGTTWMPLGSATRVGSTPNWQITGLNLPLSGRLRARGRTTGGNNNGSSGLVEQAVSFNLVVAVTAINPMTGSTVGGTNVSITGTGFTGATAVTFGGIAATSFTVDSATQITTTTPAHAADAVSVDVTTPSGTNAANTLYTYVTPPAVTTATADLLSNVTTLVINGANFSPTPGSNTVVFTPAGTGTVTTATPTSLTVTGLSGLTLGALNAVVTTSGLNSGAAVQVATVIATGPGDLDALDANVVGSYVNATAVQPDGKTIIAGSFTSMLGEPRTNIARLNADGTLDAAFNPNANGSVNCVAVQADGQILLGGDFTTLGGTGRNRIARVAADGTLDAVFNPNASNSVYSVAVHADGKILLAGAFTSVGGTGRNRIARVAANGTLDAGFNPNVNGSIYSVAVQADGPILLGGNFTTVGGIGRNSIARVADNGTLDAGFNPDANSLVNSVAMQADGQILLGGWFATVGGTTRNLLARLVNDPATQTLSAVDSTQVLWSRGGSAPEVTQTTLELSTNGGSTWTPLGSATQVGSTSNWQLTGLSLPASGQLRARGRAIGGLNNGSSGLIEQVVGFGPDADNDGLRNSWEELYWPGATELHGPLDDEDHDGLVNLLELAFGLNPTLPNAGALMPLTQEDGYLTMTITKQPGVAYEVQSAGTLTPGQPDYFSASSTTVLINDASTLKVCDNTLFGTPPARFMRVQVTGAP